MVNQPVNLTETLIVPKGLLPALHDYLSRSRLPYVEVRAFLDAIEATRPAETPTDPERIDA